ncbi:hypothetical protein QBC41DRAFT_301704 [Cercophora samala]|uniref:Uncharacterized protein n=1 Tax=Cercophora samala TaxID=330535 RepID=A0AA39ZG18_9PEZI|nr:hypothetical protein QBC41DRAFT_301704 [Cercophora samala]
MYKRYGPIVRINPHELHILDPDFYDERYGCGVDSKRKLDKYVPETLEELRRELDVAIPNEQDTPPWSTLQQLPNLTAVTEEALRLSTTLPQGFLEWHTRLSSTRTM